jgi:L-alanine-DL-glutamate epimerase-like enolase superfamily enzyme
LKIRAVELYHVPRKLRKPFVTSLGYNEYAHSVYLKIITDTDLVGYGECTPSPYINGETHETCFVVGKILAQGLIGKNPTDIESSFELMSKLIYANNSIKSAFDIAHYDLISKSKELPLYKYFGGEIRKKIYTDYTVSIGEVEEMVEDAVKVKEDGYQIIKVKLGKGGDKDIKRIKNIREVVGADIKIRIDANQGWEVNEAERTLTALREFDIEYCEEPIRRYKFDILPELRRQSPVKIMADESVLDHYDAHRLIKTGACDYINIKLGKSSGIFKALKIIKAAEKAKMKLQLGGFLESRLLFTANAHLAHTSKYCAFYDFDSPLFAIDNPILGGMEYGNNGEVILNDEPGLGLSIDDEYLKNVNKLVVK